MSGSALDDPPHDPRCPDSENCWSCCTGVYKNRKCLCGEGPLHAKGCPAEPPPDPLTPYGVVSVLRGGVIAQRGGKYLPDIEAQALVERYARQEGMRRVEQEVRHWEAKLAERDKRIVDLETQIKTLRLANNGLADRVNDLSGDTVQKVLGTTGPWPDTSALERIAEDALKLAERIKRELERP